MSLQQELPIFWRHFSRRLYYGVFFVPLKFTKQKRHYVGKGCFQISNNDEIITNLINSHEKDPSECTLFSYCMYMFSRVNSYVKSILKLYWKFYACRKSLLFNDRFISCGIRIVCGWNYNENILQFFTNFSALKIYSNTQIIGVASLKLLDMSLNIVTWKMLQSV